MRRAGYGETEPSPRAISESVRAGAVRLVASARAVRIVHAELRRVMLRGKRGRRTNKADDPSEHHNSKLALHGPPLPSRGSFRSGHAQLYCNHASCQPIVPVEHDLPNLWGPWISSRHPEQAPTRHRAMSVARRTPPPFSVVCPRWSRRDRTSAGCGWIRTPLCRRRWRGRGRRRSRSAVARSRT